MREWAENTEMDGSDADARERFACIGTMSMQAFFMRDDCSRLALGDTMPLGQLRVTGATIHERIS